MSEKISKLPLVSVIIPFYNNVSWLCEAVESVLSQDYENYEILVINDGSNENVDEFLAKYSHKVSFFEKENGGPAGNSDELAENIRKFARSDIKELIYNSCAYYKNAFGKNIFVSKLEEFLSEQIKAD